MDMLDNVHSTVKESLQKTIKAHSKIQIASGCFSIYAYQELKKTRGK